MVSEWVVGTRGSGILSSVDDVLWMSGLGFTIPVGTWGVLDVCLCLGKIGLRWCGWCKWGGCLDQGLEGCCSVMSF